MKYESDKTILSPDLHRLLDGYHLADKQHIAMSLLTVSEEGYPHQAMVSAGEVLAMNETTLRIALWQGTHTSANLLRDGKALLAFVHDGISYTLMLKAMPLPPIDNSLYPRDRFEAQLIQVREDIAQYAMLTSGVTIQLHEPEQVLARWEDTLAELRR